MTKKGRDKQADKTSKAKHKRKKPPYGWRPIFRGALSDLSSHSWLQNLLVGSALLLIWPLIGATIMKSYRATIIGFGIGATLLIWIFVFILLRQTSADDLPKETELHGVLVPANELSPLNPCDRPEYPLPPEAVSLFLGNVVVWTIRFPAIAVQARGLDLMTIKKAQEGLLLSAKVFSSDGKIIADLEDNEFHINPNNYFKIKRPDRSTLTVYDQQDQMVLNVRYLNPKAVKLSGVFHIPGSRPIVIDDGKFRPMFERSDSICLGNNVIGVFIP